MHPHHRGGGWYRYCGRRRPSRLLWFVLGAFSATWFFKHKEACRYKVAHCVRYQIPQEAYPHPGLNNHAQQQQPQQPPPQYSESPNQSQSQTTPHPSLPSAAYPAGAAATPSHSTLPPPSPPQTPLTQQDGCHRPWGWGQGCGSNNAWEWGSRPGMEAHRPFPADRWDEDRKRMHDIGRQAQETFTEFSEATLDTLLSTIEALKAKLAEQKAQREKEEKEIEALREEQARQYEEWKQQQQQQSRHIV